MNCNNSTVSVIDHGECEYVGGSGWQVKGVVFMRAVRRPAPCPPLASPHISPSMS